jgi:hypothetical protein
VADVHGRGHPRSHPLTDFTYCGTCRFQSRIDSSEIHTPV